MNISISFLLGGFLIYLAIGALIIYLIVLIMKALQKYIRSDGIRKEKDRITKSLGEALKENRTRCKMTQEFVAESVGVSRQAVSKWENGISDPSTSNLLALANLYGISAEDLLKAVKE
ncbi:helix-turn-helix protein [anaerobic digester metagenome]